MTQTRGQYMLATHHMIRVGNHEVWVKPDGNIKPAILAVIHEVNGKCAERGIDVIFGEPEFETDDYRHVEIYPHARVVFTKDKRDGTVRIVASDALAEEIFAEVWDEIAERVVEIRHAHTVPGVKLEQIEWYTPRLDQ